MTPIDFMFFHRLSLCDNMWMNFKSMHSFFAETMLGQTLLFLVWLNLRYFHSFCHINKHKIYAERVLKYRL